jgi:5'-phosphate synthase pdxT subunit
VRIGVLALQGAFARHLEVLSRLEVEAREIRLPQELEETDGLIIPGGESTTMTRIMKAEGWFDELKAWSQQHPLFGTCAGLILMASQIDDSRVDTLGCLPIKAHRNCYGSQVWSFRDVGTITGLPGHQDMEMVFIRAPKFEVLSDDLEILGRCRGEAVLIKQGHHLAASFHPELGDDTRIHRFWLELVQAAGQSRRGLDQEAVREHPPSSL